ncbi:M10 family metallopeptidase C-terminal domain-containing protein [Planktothrix agardhii]|jgi:serralysin|uniref:M10 family metallopeptidase C-terminal domain-containing protein n=1 Tax=Planktothrix agardhii TaxID=1160 RepID=UPI0028AA088D|nr:M10 family metallopeptidase C-terminal domain-containing protein [Planktothrix agardhii]
MTETLFLEQIAPSYTSTPNFATAEVSSIFSNYNQPASATLTDAQTEALVKDGVAAAIANALAVFNNDPTVSVLFNDSLAIGSNGSYQGSASSKTEVIANFSVGANQKFSFDFSANLKLAAKEIEKSKTEYNEAHGQASFLLLDTSNFNQPKVLDYFVMSGDLISSKDIHKLKFSSSKNVKLKNKNKHPNIESDNGTDLLTGDAIGTYQQTFKRNTNLTLVELDSSAVQVLGDPLIANQASINGTNSHDILIGGSGNQVIKGDKNTDLFVFTKGDGLQKGDLDVIKDFKVGEDKIEFRGEGSNINSSDWWQTGVAQGQITDTKDGALVNADSGGQILLSGVKLNQLSPNNFIFT